MGSLPIKNILKFFKSGSGKIVLENIISLGSLRVLNIVFPLILAPYLINTLGTAQYGLVVFAYATVQYLIIISNYGFQYSATKQIAEQKKDIIRVSVIFSNVITTRIILAVCLVIFFGLLFFIVPKFKNEYILMIFTTLVLIGDVLFPIWLFQGLQKMKYITIFRFINQLITLIFVLVIVTSKNDYIYVNLIRGICYISTSIFTLIFINKYFQINYYLPRIKDIKEQITYSLPFFLSNIGINLYRNANILILGFTTSDTLVGIYAISEKIIKAFQSLVAPISEAIFPYFTTRFQKRAIRDNVKEIFGLSKLYSIILILYLFISLFVSKLLVRYFINTHIDVILLNILIMSPIIFLGALNHFWGITGLINLGFQNSFAKYVFISGIFALFITIFFSSFIHEKAGSVSLVFSELLLLVLLLRHLIVENKK